MKAPVCLDVEYRPVPDYRGYSVSAAGVMYGPRGRPLRPKVDKSGHLYVRTKRAPSPGMLYVHRAVLTAWVGPCPEGMESRHLDGQPGHNAVRNLAWGTRLDNIQDRARHGVQLRGEQVAGAKLTADQVSELRALHGTASLRTLARRYGVSHWAVMRAISGRTWAHLS
jgi:hypothetical protein